MTTQSKFTITIERVDDRDPDLSWLGEYTDKPTFPYWDRAASEVIHNEEEAEKHADLYRSTREYNYVHSFQCPEDDKAIEQDARRLISYGNDWSMMGIVVSASLDGYEWGQASLWGIESDSDDSCFEETESDLTEEAIAEAKKSLASFLAKNCNHTEGGAK